MTDSRDDGTRESTAPVPTDGPVAARRQGRPPNTDSEETRRRILDAALHAFAHDGFAGTPTRAIAKAAGVTVSTVYHHFSSKRALYVAAYTHAIDLSYAEYDAAIAGAASLTDELTTILQTSLDLMRRHPEITMLVLRAQTDLDDPELRPHKVPPSAYRLIRELSHRAVARGELEPGEVHAFSYVFGVALWGLSVIGISDEIARERTVRALEGLVLADGRRRAAARAAAVPAPPTERAPRRDRRA